MATAARASESSAHASRHGLALEPDANTFRAGPARPNNDPRRGRGLSSPVPGRAASLEEVDQVTTQAQPELIDVMMEVYVEWREECIALRNAYERWSSVRVAERELAFAAYRAALDREDRASAVYADLVRSVERELEVRTPEQPGVR
jgi:hypothetical protein